MRTVYKKLFQSKILKLYLRNFIIYNYKKIFWLTNHKFNHHFEIYLNLSHIKTINKQLWQLISNYPNEILHEIKKNFMKLFFITNLHNKNYKKIKNFNIILVSNETFNTLYLENINLKIYKKLITSNLKIISQSKKKIKLLKLKIFCMKCKKIFNFNFDNNYQSIKFTKIFILIHNNKQYTKCNKESIYFIKNSSIFIFEKFFKCHYIPITRKLLNKYMNIIGISNYNSLFSLIIGQRYDLIGILDIYRENIIIPGSKKIFIIIKLLGLKFELYKNCHEKIWYNFITNFRSITNTNSFLDKIKSILFQNVAGFELLKSVISCLLFIGYYEYKNALIHISEKFIIGLISYPEFYNLLISRLLDFTHNNFNINIIKTEKSSSHKTKKRSSIDEYIKKFKNKKNDVLIFEHFEMLPNIFYDFIYELNEKDNYSLITRDHHLNFNSSIAIVTNLNMTIQGGLQYLTRKKERINSNVLVNFFKYYDLIFDIKKNVFSNIIIEKNSSTIYYNMSFFNQALQKSPHSIITIDYFLIIQKIKSLKIAHFSEYLLKYIIKIYITYRKYGGFFDTIIMSPRNLNLVLKLSRLLAKANLSTYIKKKHIDKAFKIIGYSQINFADYCMLKKFNPFRINFFNIVKKIILNIFFKINILSIGKLFFNLKKLGIPVSYSNYVILTFLINQKIIMIGNYLKINNNIML